MKFFLQIVCVCLLLKLNLCESKCAGNRRAVNRHTGLSKGELDISEKLVDKYGKYVVYIWSDNETHPDWGFWAGVIIKDDVILTFYADYGEYKKIARVAPGARRFNKKAFGSMIKFVDAINMNHEMEDLPQLSLIRLEKKLTLNENVSVLPLPDKRHHKDDICVTLSWGRYNQFPEVMAHNVKIQDDCGTGIICLELEFDNQHLDPCAAYTGGEPIFCSGTLAGIIVFNDICDHNITKATSVFDNLKWIESKMDKFNSDHLSVKSSDGGNTLHKNLYIFIIHIYILIMTTINVNFIW